MKRALALVVIFPLMCAPSSTLTALPDAVVPEEHVAIVCLLSGKGFATFDNERTQLSLFQRLRPGTHVETGSESRVVLAFATGDRYEFGEMASGTLRQTGLDSTKGTIRKLAPVPAQVDIAAIAREELPGTRLAAARIRTGAKTETMVVNLYPARGAAAIAEATTLRFDPVDGYRKYRIDIEDDTGNAIFSIETASTLVQVPSGVLRSGAQYYWRVRAQDSERPAARGEAVFSTLSDQNAARRAALKAYAEEAKDPSVLGLLAEFDRGLGMQREACEELKAALDQSPGNHPLAGMLTRFGCMESDGPAKQEN